MHVPYDVEIFCTSIELTICVGCETLIYTEYGSYATVLDINLSERICIGSGHDTIRKLYALDLKVCVTQMDPSAQHYTKFNISSTISVGCTRKSDANEVSVSTYF